MTPRARALDVLRGLTLALMIVVNMSISESLSYAPLLHAAWNGLTPTDLVFPSFLFAVGASLAFTLPRHAALGHGAVLGWALRRAALLFACGFVLNQFPFFKIDAAGQWHWMDWSHVRILGVLQRIGLAFAIAALLIHFGRGRGLLAFSVAVLVANAWVLANCGDDSLTGNAAVRLDRWLLGPPHLYAGEGQPFDPEGLLGLLPSVVNVLGGYVAAGWVRQLGAGWPLLRRLLLASLCLLALALAVQGVVPVNKKLWSSSFVLVGLGVDAALLALLVLLVDLWRWERPAKFFEILGRNTLAIYLLSEVLQALLWTLPWGAEPAFMGVFRRAFQPWAGDKPGSLAFALVFMLGCWTVAWWMDRRRIYIRA
ncbi:acyltransferase family protein [Roseateles sp.]|uniref:acyltransferase family protein n=1 Tax=Roseateles sp. TaxID=1971397 RepID=UPI002DF7F6A6|nr:heparan-alpha-glucosaminide N-acetyltransferase domain-containing protein [Roseateles sp.]